MVDSFEQTIEGLRAKVQALHNEVDLLVTFHEAWKPAAYDKELHRRLDHSYAGNVFLIIRSALRREMLLSLSRIWDQSGNTIQIQNITSKIKKPWFVNGLVKTRAAQQGDADFDAALEAAFTKSRDECLRIYDKYVKGGSCYTVREDVSKLRHKRLAHREPKGFVLEDDAFPDGAIEGFYNDSVEIVRLLLALILGLAYDPKETAEIYRGHARCFWAAVCGERTTGHPEFLKRTVKVIPS